MTRVRWQVVFSKPVTGVNASQFTLPGTGLTAAPPDFGGIRKQMPRAFGMNGVFGRGDGSVTPKIIRVNTLTHNTPITSVGDGTYQGGIKSALQTPGPRYIICEDSGTIDYGTDFCYVTDPYFYLTGATAPGLGVNLIGGDGGNALIEVNTHDCIISHIRARAGGGSSLCYSALGAWDERPYFGGRPFNVVFDHVSCAWGQDENLYAFGDDISYWRCLTAEALYRTAGTSGCGGGGLSAGHGLLIEFNSHNVGIFGTLIVSCGRGPEVHEYTEFLVADVLNYNGCGPLINNNPAASLWYQDGSFGPPYVTKGTYQNFRAIGGPDTDPASNAIQVYIERIGNQIYMADCTKVGYANLFVFDGGTDPTVSTPPVAIPSGFTSVGSSQLQSWLALNVGARPKTRDSADIQFINDLIDGVGSWKQTRPASPTIPHLHQTYTVPINPFGDIDSFGRNNIDRDLDRIADSLEGSQPLSGSYIESVVPQFSTPAGTTFNVTAVLGPGAGTLGCNLLATGNIVDTNGNKLTQPFVGQVYDVITATPGTKAVLNPSTDLTFLGVLRPPSELASWPVAMTSRVVGGQFRLIHWSQNNFRCLEWVPGTPSMDQTFAGIPFSSYLRDYGNFFGTYGGFGYEPGSHTTENVNDMKADFLHWRENESALYYGSTSYYNNDASGSCCNIGKAIESSPGVFNTQGFWFTDNPRNAGGFGNRWCNNLTEFPDWLASYFGGRKIGIGGGSQYWQGIESNNISQIPTLFAMNPIVAGNQPYLGKLASSPIPLMFCPYYAFGNGLGNPIYPQQFNNAYTVTPRIGRRAPTAVTINRYGNPNETRYPGSPTDAWLQDPLINGGATYLTAQDQNHGMIYIDGPNLHGLLYGSTLVQGNFQTVVRGATLVTTIGSTQVWNLRVDSTSGMSPNMCVYLEDSNAPTYGGWPAALIHQDGIYAPNLPGGNTNSPILDSTHVLVINLGSPTWDATQSIGKKLVGGYYYAGGGWRAPSMRCWLSVYDPDDIAAQAALGVNLSTDYSQLDAKYWSEMAVNRRRENDLFFNLMPGITAFAVDYVAKKLYVNVMGADGGPGFNDNFPLVYVFSIPGL